MASLRPGELGAWTSRDIAPMAPIWVVPGRPIFDPGQCVRGEGARQVNGSARDQVPEGMAERRRAGQGGNGLAGPGGSEVPVHRAEQGGWSPALNRGAGTEGVGMGAESPDFSSSHP